MIDVKELKIGNYYSSASEHYLSKFDDKIEQLESLLKDNKWAGGHCLISSNGNKTAIKYVKPIPLTEEILLKCGLTKHYDAKAGSDYLHLHIQGSTIRDSSHIRFDIEENSSITWKGWIFNQNQVDFFIPYDLKYLHQLQNIYFALSGKELDVVL